MITYTLFFKQLVRSLFPTYTKLLNAIEMGEVTPVRYMLEDLATAAQREQPVDVLNGDVPSLVDTEELYNIWMFEYDKNNGMTEEEMFKYSFTVNEF